MIGSEEVLDLEEDREIELNALDQFQAVEPEGEEGEDDMQLDQEQDDDDDEEEESSEQEDDEGFDSEDDMEDDDDDDDDDMEEDDDNNATIVTKEMLDEWIKGARAKSPDALKHLLMAFRSITRADDGTDTQMTYRVINHKRKKDGWL